MHSRIYERIIEEWCSATGMEPWPAEAEVTVTIEGTPVAIVYDGEHAPSSLNFFIDTGWACSPDEFGNLLARNIQLAPGCGHFALHPDTGNVLYRTSLELAEGVDGASLPEWLCDRAAEARIRLQH
jgi:hypothetical protein